MDHTQAVFLGHYIPMAIAFWLWCWYHSLESKKARQMLKHLNERRRNLFNFSIPQLRERRRNVITPVFRGRKD